MSGTIHKEWRGVVGELEANGCEVLATKNHLAVVKDGKRVATLPSTPSDVKGRGLQNTRAMLRRLGLIPTRRGTFDEPLHARARDGEAGSVGGIRLG